MFTDLIQPVLHFMHILQKLGSFVLTTSYYIGRVVFMVLLKVYNFLGDVFAALVIIGEEFFHFLCELDKSLTAVYLYVQTSANSGVNCVAEAVLVFCHHIGKFFSNTKLYSKLLATNFGVFICDICDLTRKALVLIGDSFLWLVTLIPLSIINAGIAVGDTVVDFITSIWKGVFYVLAVIVENIFRMTIAVVLLLVLWHNRRRLIQALQTILFTVGMTLKYCYRRLLLLITFRRSQNTIRLRPPVRRSSVSPALSDKSVDFRHSCVVCQCRQKRVLLLPCKHLCLCDECADYMMYTLEIKTCPLCRSNVNDFIFVYI